MAIVTLIESTLVQEVFFLLLVKSVRLVFDNWVHVNVFSVSCFDCLLSDSGFEGLERFELLSQLRDVV